MVRWNAEHWSAIAPLLDRALDLDSAERERWLVELSGAEPNLTADLRRLLASHELNAVTEFLEYSPLTLKAEPVIGQKVGAYALQARLGSGGMGSVWLANRSDGHFDSKVAIKILDHRGLGRRGADQIRREAGLLARQSHANTARLFDAGFLDSGQPFLILEYVDGQRIDEYCRNPNLTIKERLQLVLPVIDAVAHAHAAQIVHGDLKPSNILVSREGVPKLLDFGVASLLSKSMPLEAAISQQQSALGMTLGYAAPEQIRGEMITPASDVYALGMVLHVLITGQHPYLSDTSTHTQLIRAALTDDPELASASVENTSKRSVQGDLDAVIALATDRDAQRRYASAAELAADVRRLLSIQPVLARPHNVLERTFMWSRRERKWAVPMLFAAAIVAVVLVSAVMWRQAKLHHQAVSAGLPPEHSVAVLPFVDMSEKKDQEYFSDGLSEELINELTKIPDLIVPARTSSFYFKGKQSTIPEIAKALGVALVLEGSVRKVGNALRVTAQLVRAENGYHVWSETYDRTVDDIFAIQDEIAGAVVKALKVSMLDDTSPDVGETRSIAANDLYQRAKHDYEHAQGPTFTVDVIALLRQAIKIDRNFARAWALLARALTADVLHPLLVSAEKSAGLDVSAIAAEAKSAAENAVTLSPHLPEAHIALGRVFAWIDKDIGGAEHEFRRALELNPRDADALMQMSALAWAQGQERERQTLAEKALALDPLNSNILVMNGEMNLRFANYEVAESLLKRLQQVSPQDGDLAVDLGVALLFNGKPAEALAEFKNAADYVKNKWWYEAMTLPALGRQDDAERGLANILVANDTVKKNGALIAEVYGYRGDADRALQWLQKLYVVDPDQLKSGYLDNGTFNPIRNDPRFVVLMKKVGHY